MLSLARSGEAEVFVFSRSSECSKDRSKLQSGDDSEDEFFDAQSDVDYSAIRDN